MCEKEAAAADIIFEQTGTLGVRRQRLSRLVADRGHFGVTVAGEQVRVKWGSSVDGAVSVAPEYEDAAAAATVTGIPLKDVLQLAGSAARGMSWGWIVESQEPILAVLREGGHTVSNVLHPEQSSGVSLSSVCRLPTFLSVWSTWFCCPASRTERATGRARRRALRGARGLRT